jgi:hypothetical protein
MSALPLKADIPRRHVGVRFGPIAEVAVIRSVELIVQPDAKDVVGCCPLSPHQRHEAVARREAGEALVKIGPSFTSATISRLARRKGYI